MIEYKVINGTFYDGRTPDEVVRVLEKARLNRTRLHISLGDTNTGRDWLEEFDSHGYIGRSMGPVKVPLMIANKRSMGGGAILDHCIVRVRESGGGRILYQHPKYHHGEIQIRNKVQTVDLGDGRVLTVDLLRDGELHASFENVEKARRWIQRLGLTVV